jgi:hypothetical protein
MNGYAARSSTTRRRGEPGSVPLGLRAGAGEIRVIHLWHVNGIPVFSVNICRFFRRFAHNVSALVAWPYADRWRAVLKSKTYENKSIKFHLSGFEIDRSTYDEPTGRG